MLSVGFAEPTKSPPPLFPSTPPCHWPGRSLPSLWKHHVWPWTSDWPLSCVCLCFMNAEGKRKESKHTHTHKREGRGVGNESKRLLKSIFLYWHWPDQWVQCYTNINHLILFLLFAPIKTFFFLVHNIFIFKLKCSYFVSLTKGRRGVGRLAVGGSVLGFSRFPSPDEIVAFKGPIWYFANVFYHNNMCL